MCSIEHGLSTWQKQKSSLKSESLILAGQNVYRLGGNPKIVLMVHRGEANEV